MAVVEAFGCVQKATVPANNHRMGNSVPVIWAGVGGYVILPHAAGVLKIWK